MKKLFLIAVMVVAFCSPLFGQDCYECVKYEHFCKVYYYNNRTGITGWEQMKADLKIKGDAGWWVQTMTTSTTGHPTVMYGRCLKWRRINE